MACQLQNLLHILCPFNIHRSEGSGDPMVIRRGSSTHSYPPKKSRNTHVFKESHGTPKPNAKRSYCRAVRRAAVHGWTFYRGRLLTNVHPPQQPEVTTVLQRSRKDGQRHPSTKRCWSGSLSTKWTYASCKAFVCWREDRTWVAAGYSFIQSGDPDGGKVMQG